MRKIFARHPSNGLPTLFAGLALSSVYGEKGRFLQNNKNDKKDEINVFDYQRRSCGAFKKIP